MSSSQSKCKMYKFKKIAGTNFSHYKEQIQGVLIQTKQLKPLKRIMAKPITMFAEDWNELDALAKSTVRLHLVESIYFIVVNVHEM